MSLTFNVCMRQLICNSDKAQQINQALHHEVSPEVTATTQNPPNDVTEIVEIFHDGM